jgi:hypothetical protein
MADTPLTNVPGWTSDLVERLAQAWITSAEQVVALGATDGGLQSLAEQLGVSDEQARHLVAAARAQLSPAQRAEMETAVDTSEYGLGSRRPRQDTEGT